MTGKSARVICWLWFIAISVNLFIQDPTNLFGQDTGGWIKILSNVETGSAGVAEASKAAIQLQRLDPKLLESVLAAMDSASPLGRNWLASVATTLYNKSSAKPREALESYLANQSHNGEARFMVFQWLTNDNPELRLSMLKTMQNDSSLELRFHAIAFALEQAKPLEEISDKSSAINELKKLFDVSRHPDQVVAIAKKIESLGSQVDQAKHFGFLMNWSLIGPFDHVDTKNFDHPFQVEKDLLSGKFNPQIKYEGKAGMVAWKKFDSTQPTGSVDLNQAYNNEKGAIVYARTDFQYNTGSQSDTGSQNNTGKDCELRLGCFNGNKVWLNGELVISNNVYHMGSQIDQFIGKGKLKAGSNEIVVKICQNEQTEQWAQDFAFQLRVCDPQGKAILATDRKDSPTK